MTSTAHASIVRSALERRKLKTGYLQALKHSGAFELARRAARGRLRILCYHGIWLGPCSFPGDSMFMRAQDFARRMRMLQTMGYNILPLAEAIDRLQSGRLPPEAAVITIDDGWYGTFGVMLPILRELRLPATLYCDTAHLEWGRPIPHVMATYLKTCAHAPVPPAAEALYSAATNLGSKITDRLLAVRAYAAACSIDLKPYLENRAFDYMTPQELRIARLNGLDVQLHTHRHSLHDFTSKEIQREIEDNRAALGELLGSGNFAHFCYPSGEHRLEACDMLAKLGIKSATTLRPGLCRRSGQDVMRLPRLIDGSHQSDLEFEAVLAGIGHWHRGAGRLLATLGL